MFFEMAKKLSIMMVDDDHQWLILLILDEIDRLIDLFVCSIANQQKRICFSSCYVFFPRNQIKSINDEWNVFVFPKLIAHHHPHLTTTTKIERFFPSHRENTITIRICFFPATLSQINNFKGQKDVCFRFLLIQNEKKLR